MLCRIVAYIIFSSLVCFARPLPNPQSPSTEPFGDPQPSIAPTAPTEPRISVARLRVPGKARALYNEAIKLFVKDKFLDAERKLDQALKIYASFPDALTLRGGVFLRFRNWQPAEQDFEAAIACDPGFSPAYIGLSDLYNEQSRFDDALRSIRAGRYVDTWSLEHTV
jgi:tetratricopeptide (TPR) repeat protein